MSAGPGYHRVMLWSVVLGGGPAFRVRRSMAWIERISAEDSEMGQDWSSGLGIKTKVSSWRGSGMSIALGPWAVEAQHWGVRECVCLAENCCVATSAAEQESANVSFAWAQDRRVRAEGLLAAFWEVRGLDESWLGSEGAARLDALLAREALSNACELGQPQGVKSSL